MSPISDCCNMLTILNNDAINPFVGDCKPCLCPGNAVAQEPNVFAATCRSHTNGGYVCLNCTQGHGGDHCESCVNNWYGTPTNASVSYLTLYRHSIKQNIISNISECR